MRLPELNPQTQATVIPIGLLTTTRYCWAGCAFCRWAIPAPHKPLSESPAGLAWDQVEKAHVDLSQVAEVRLRGGLSLAEPFDYWIHFLRKLRRKTQGKIIGFSPVEVWQFHLTEHRTLRELLGLLRWAGVDRLGPGGSETWNEERRQHWAPNRITVDEWLRVAETARVMGLATTAGPIVLPRMPKEAWGEYLSGLGDLSPDLMELKPLRSEGTRLSRMGNTGVLETAQAVDAIRQLDARLPLYVRWEGSDYRDAQEILGAVGADGLALPLWEVAP